jgi:hypothetical protein
MGRLAQLVVIEADVAVRRMSQDQKVRLADEIYAQQPNMLASILALPRMRIVNCSGMSIKPAALTVIGGSTTCSNSVLMTSACLCAITVRDTRQTTAASVS